MCLDMLRKPKEGEFPEFVLAYKIASNTRTSQEDFIRPRFVHSHKRFKFGRWYTARNKGENGFHAYLQIPHDTGIPTHFCAVLLTDITSVGFASGVAAITANRMQPLGWIKLQGAKLKVKGENNG